MNIEKRDGMQKIELLAPAGTMEALQAAIHNGCDAVYLGGTLFGARAFAGNFDCEEMKEAIQFAHLYGVKVYVTMNTLIYEDEIDEAYAYAKFLYTHGADALILQDLGLFDRIRTQLPDFELHASTQMHIHNVEGIRLLKEKGAQRIVLPRETMIEEIKEFAKESIDLEVFIHGALCISYSGQCLMSEELFQRSGNRGECAQACRMKYQLVKVQQGQEEIISTNGDYILSPKDLNTLEKIPQLIEAGITSFKIEGRMKRPAYVAQVVSLYRKAIDAYNAKQKFVISDDIKRDMRLIFNREFTQGHLFHARGNELMHAFRPNHMGIPIGKVIRASKKNITIALQADVHQGDGIRILQKKEDQGLLLHKIYKNGLLVNKACKGEQIELECDAYIEPNAVVLKTSDVLQLQQLQNYPLKRMPINMQAEFFIGKAMKLTISDGVHSITQLSKQLIEEAKTSIMQEDRIKAQLSKCNDTPFEIQSLNIQFDKTSFLSIKALNELRREAFTTFLEVCRNAQRDIQEKPYVKIPKQIENILPKQIFIVQNKQQYDACLEEGFEPKYASSLELANEKDLQFTNGSIQKIQDHSDLVCECGGLRKVNCNICEPSLYATNAYTCAFLKDQGIQQIIVPYEITTDRIKQMIHTYREKFDHHLQFGIEVYGYRDLMISEYCPIQTYEGTKKHCNLCKTASYYLEDVKKQRFHLQGDTNCRMHILSMKPHDLIKEYRQFQNIGIQVYQFRFTIESKEEVQRIIKKWKQNFTD